MITEAEFKAIQAKMDNHEMITPEEASAVMEYSVAQATAALEANPINYTCAKCGGENVISSINEIVICQWCGEPLLMDSSWME